MKKLAGFVLFSVFLVPTLYAAQVALDVERGSVYPVSGTVSGSAPASADYLMGTTNASVTGEIVVGTTPGGELGNTWASPTVDDGISITNLTLVTPILGTPQSGTLTNATGLPATGLVADTTTALGVGSVNLGHASDTTIARVSAGLVSVEGANVRLFKTTSTNAPGATPTIATIPNANNIVHLTGLATAVTSMTTNLTGTPVEGDSLRIDFTDDGTARAITWGASFEASGGVALPTTTVISTRMDVAFVWNVATTKWHCVGVA